VFCIEEDGVLLADFIRPSLMHRQDIAASRFKVDDNGLEREGIQLSVPLRVPGQSEPVSRQQAKLGSDGMPSAEKLYDSEEEKEFTRKLYKYMAEKGQPIVKVPSLGFQDLNLFKLYQLVIKRGGMDVVTKNQAWKSVYLDLGLSTMSTSASYNTRTNYKKYAAPAYRPAFLISNFLLDICTCTSWSISGPLKVMPRQSISLACKNI
jgi:ARID/BRIGHT DNA binding domain